MIKFLLLVTVLVHLNSVYGNLIKGLFCKDPDTGKLYPINSTWQSESFCGNYTCKLRKKNVTETEYTPITKVNITKDLVENNNMLQNDMSTSPSENSLAIIKKIDSTRQPVFNKDAYKIDEIKENYESLDNTDRYLTESEISTITEILRTVKKSDLEAIIEIYNLAQEIYDEMETNEQQVKTTQDASKFDEVMKNQDSISYWYEPLQYRNKKVKDLKTETSNTVPVNQMYPNPVNYFRPTPEKDLMGMPYYYPISDFHRMSSYMHKPFLVPPPPPVKETPKPCSKQFYSPWYPTKPVTPRQPMLPYPFSNIHHYNLSYPASFYYSTFPWAQLDIYNRNKNYPQPYGMYLPQEIPTTIPQESEVKNVEEEKEIKEVALNEETLAVPEWQTEELPKNVLEEVKANILEKSKLLKPLSLRKNIKLEKVGKVIKLDELLRKKRHIVDSASDVDRSQYEAYVEKTTCDSQVPTEPGYFRVGNVSQPFPACCPQRIKTIKTINSRETQ